MKMTSLHDLFVDQLQDLYSAENQLIKALPKMAKAASSPELRSAFEEHLEQTRDQAERLERVFEMMDAKAKGKKCKAMEGLIEEAKETVGEDAEPAVLDAALIAEAQKVEHYEIAGYGCVCTWAEQLGHREAAQLLKETLNEEKMTDERLTQLAESMVNVEAAAGDGEEP
jgi:ferritin-like metal-binding protein YciE